MNIKIYGADWCPDCVNAKNFLSSKAVAFEYIIITDNPEAIAYVEKINDGRRVIPTIVDPKTKNFKSYKNCAIFKPNLKEIKIGCNINFDENNMSEINSATKDLLEMINAKGILLTLSGKGICMQTADNFTHTKAGKRNITDVSGAGDTVISTAALCLASNVDFVSLSRFANLAGGLVCQRVGVVPIEKTELLKNTISYFTN